MFFLGGVGEGKKTRQGKYCRVVFVGDARVKQPHFLCYILYIEQWTEWRFRYRMFQDHREGVPESPYPGQYARVEVFDNLKNSFTHGRQ